jgi:hypothetical protein
MHLALARYEEQRNRASKDEYLLNLNLAAGRPLPETYANLRAAVQGDSQATRQFFLANQGMIPRETFFNDENMQNLLGERARRTA